MDGVMKEARLLQLLAFYREDPNDPFNAYALAIEYLNHDPSRSKELFELLLKDHADYLPTYYHAAQLFLQLGQEDQALKVLETGMEVAKRQNDTKTLRELRSVYDELQFG